MKTKHTGIFGTTVVQVNGKIWVEQEGNRFLGPGPIELLERIGQNGSISQAAKSMNISFTKAWHIINKLNTISKEPMVITAIGGEKGGGSTLSADAWKAINYYKGLQERFHAFLDIETKNLNRQ